MDFIERDTLFLHGYASPDMPDHKGIFAVDMSTGRKRWSNDSMRALFAYGSFVYADRIERDERRFYELDSGDGSVRREIDAAAIGEMRNTLPPPAGEVIFPAVRDPERGFADPDAERLYLAHHLGEQGTGLLEFIARPGAAVFGICEQRGTNPLRRAWAQRLVVFDREGRNVLFEASLSAESPVCVPDTFFCIEEWMYFMQDRTTICAVRLPTPRDGQDTHKTD
jgi:hypothetical protein